MIRIPNDQDAAALKYITNLLLKQFKLYIDSHPFSTCSEIVGVIKNTFGFICSRQIVSNVLKTKLGISKKKAHYVGKPSPDKVEIFVKQRGVYITEGRKFVILDETGFSHNTGYNRGYCKRGTRLRVVSHGTVRSHNTSVLAAISETELLTYEKLKGAFTRAHFLNFLQQNRNIFRLDV